MERKRWKEPDNTLWRLCEYEYAFCPVCAKSVWMGFDTTEQAQNSWDEEHLYAYCPHCGTKMFKDNGDVADEDDEPDYDGDDGEWVDPPPMTPEESDREFKRKNHFLEASDRCCSNCRYHKTHYEHKDHDELMIQKCKLSGLVSQREIDVDFTTSCDQWDMKDEGIYNKTMNPYVELS